MCSPTIQIGFALGTWGAWTESRGKVRLLGASSVDFNILHNCFKKLANHSHGAISKSVNLQKSASVGRTLIHSKLKS